MTNWFDSIVMGQLLVPMPFAATETVPVPLTTLRDELRKRPAEVTKIPEVVNTGGTWTRQDCPQSTMSPEDRVLTRTHPVDPTDELRIVMQPLVVQS